MYSLLLNFLSPHTKVRVLAQLCTASWPVLTTVTAISYIYLAQYLTNQNSYSTKSTDLKTQNYHSYLWPCSGCLAVICTIATLRLTRSAYTLHIPKKSINASTYRALTQGRQSLYQHGRIHWSFFLWGLLSKPTDSASRAASWPCEFIDYVLQG